jgi:transcriptional regulator with XRE-family HTH domain
MSTSNDMQEFFLQEGAPEIERFVEKNLLITQQIFQYLRDRGWSQKDLAQALGKSEAEISKWLSGTHNLTLKSLTKLEVVLQEDIITTPFAARQQYEKIRFVKVNVYASVNEDISSGRYVELLKQTAPFKLQMVKAS